MTLGLWEQGLGAALAFLLASLFPWTNEALAQPYPNRPIRMIVPQSAGGSTDVIARVVAQRMSEGLGQTVIVDNRPGAGSLNGIELVANAAPDGYTVLVVEGSFTVKPDLQNKHP